MWRRFRRQSKSAGEAQFQRRPSVVGVQWSSARTNPCPNRELCLGCSRMFGGRGGGRTHTKSELRQILSLVRLPVPPLGPDSLDASVTPARAGPCLDRSMSFLDLLLGKPLANWQERGERIGPIAGQPRVSLWAKSLVREAAFLCVTIHPDSQRLLWKFGRKYAVHGKAGSSDHRC